MLLGKSVRTVERWAKQGILTKVKFGGATRFRESEVAKIAQDGTDRLPERRAA